jgi:hypothetical protein
MKFKHLSIILCAVLLFACKKDNDGTQVEDDHLPVDTTMRVTKGYNYEVHDTTQSPTYTDSIYYNEKNQIEKIVSQPGSDAHTFSYNDDGLLIEMSFSNTAAQRTQKYYLHYNLNKKVDSLIIVVNEEITTINSMSYNAAGDLTKIRAEIPNGGDTVISAYITYFRSNKLDSIYTDLPFGLVRRINSQFTTASTVNSRLTIDRSYLFMMAVRDYGGLFGEEQGNIYIQQFLNPDDAIMGKGKIGGYDPLDGAPTHVFSSFSNQFSYNGDNTLRFHQFSQTFNGKTYGMKSYKFEYSKK